MSNRCKLNPEKCVDDCSFHIIDRYNNGRAFIAKCVCSTCQQVFSFPIEVINIDSGPDEEEYEE